MSILLSILITLIIFAAVYYILNLLPLPNLFKQIGNVVLGVAALIWLLKVLFGIPWMF